MRLQRAVMTTGEVARICNVAPRTVSKWFDSGQLRGYRIPGSKDRRIPVDQLRRFMQAHGIPLNGLDTGEKRVLLLDGDPVFGEAVRKALSEGGAYSAETADSAFQAGAFVNEIRPHVFIVDVTRPDVVPQSMIRWIRSTPGIKDLRIIGMATEMSNASGQALLQKGFDGYLSKPFDIPTLIERIESTTAQDQLRPQ